MRVINFTNSLHYGKHFVQSQTEGKTVENFSAVSKDAAEIVAIVLIIGILFGVFSFLTMKFLELIVSLIDRLFLMPLKEVSLNLTERGEFFAGLIFHIF